MSIKKEGSSELTQSPKKRPRKQLKLEQKRFPKTEKEGSLRENSGEVFTLGLWGGKA